MQRAFYTIMGVALLLFVLNDIHRSILHSRGRNGPLSEIVCRGVWYLSKRLAFRFPRPRRHKMLNLIGPLLMPLLIILFIILVLVGFALIYIPRMPSEFTVSLATPNSPWLASLYFSGITMTTVGYGDIAPVTFSMRMVALVESASGLAFISLAITYLIAVYSALQQRSAAALTFYHHAGGAADADAFIAHHFVAGRFRGLEATLRTAARDLQQIWSFT